MNLSGIRLRLTVLILAMVCMGALIAYVTVSTQRLGDELHDKLAQVDSESFGIADQFRDRLRDVHDRLNEYRSTRSAAAWGQFQRSEQEFATWIQSQFPSAGTPREQEVLKQLNDAYVQYRRLSANLLTNPQPPALAGEEEADPLLQSRRHLFDLGQDFSAAHLELNKQLLQATTQSLARLQHTTLFALALLLVGAGILTLIMYRDLIAPLRRRLVENEAQMERQEKLASLGLLAAGVAHEIRNPLTAIRAALFTQQRRFRPDSPEHADAKVVEREILRLERIVNDFLQFARPGEPELAELPADQLLLETKLFFTPQLARSNIQIVVEPAPARRVKVDPAQIKQVLLNLVRNAAESIGQNGLITLRARPDRRHLAPGLQNVVILEVMDTGKGIPPETQKRLFDPFFTTKDTGTGLGLAIALRIVQKHGGLLEYQTQPKRGTTFGIILPELP